MVDDDMAVFFGADFATTWTRLVGADCSLVPFPAIHGVQDVEAMQGYVLNAECEITYITGDVDLKDKQLLQQSGSATIWRVQGDPVRGGDGATSTARIGKVPQ
jgi:hypothetical protein